MPPCRLALSTLLGFLIGPVHKELLTNLHEVHHDPVENQTSREFQADIANEQGHEIKHDLPRRIIGRRHALPRLDIGRQSRQDRKDIIRIGLTDTLHPKEAARPFIVKITDSVIF